MSKKVVINTAAVAALPEAAEVGKPITIQLAPEGRYPQLVDDDAADVRTGGFGSTDGK